MKEPTHRSQTAIQISDTGLQEGQGMHGGFGRDGTYNNMAAIGPDFKKNYSDDAPVSNADITPTLLYVTGIAWNTKEVLPGRVMEEALSGKTEAGAVPRKTGISESVMGSRTVLEFQEYGGERYLDEACLVSSSDSQPRCP